MFDGQTHMPQAADQSLTLEPEFPAPMYRLFEPKRYKVLYGGRGAGRCLGRGTLVMMLDGTLKPVENIQQGDYLMGPDSLPREVLGINSGTSQLYRVDQAGGGISYVVNEHHILALQKSHATYWRPDRGRYMERYPEIGSHLNINVVEYTKQSSKWKTHFFGYKTKCINFGIDADPAIDPYFLGLWLGDGTSRELRLSVNKDDWEILKWCQDYVDRWNLGMSVCRADLPGALDVGFPPIGERENKLWQIFKRLELPNNKHIPWEFTIASEWNRLKLLAGLIDSDGHCNNNGYEFCNTNKELALETKRVADFLGFKTSHRIKKANGRDRLQDAHLISINGDVWRIPCQLERKKVREENCSKNKDFLLRGLTVTAIGEGEYFGFEIDGDHLFLLEDGTVTHNTWNIARILLLIGVQRRVRVLCAREFQNSIADSVHRVLSDQINELGLNAFYDIEVARIKGKNGTLFGFEGIKNNTTRIKSYEGVDYCWVEEAVSVSKDSWRILIPTIRKEICSNGHRLRGTQQYREADGSMLCPVCKEKILQSEIWMSFNPDMETDYTYQRFVVNGDENRSFIIHMTHKDNPWFPDVLRQEMESDRELGMQPGHEQDYADYLNVWEGHCKQVLTGAVYARELLRATEDGRVCTVPWEREWPVDVFFDLGRADNTAMWFGQRVAMQYRWLDYYEASGQHISHFMQEMQHKGYTYGTIWLPHDAKAKRLGSKRTIEEQVKQAGYRVQIVPKLSISDGINAARTIFPNSWFDEDNTRDGVLALRNYRYRVINDKLSNEPLHDWASDGADAFRYAAIAMKQPQERTQGALKRTLDALSAAARRGREEEFSGRPSMNVNWLGR